MRRTVAVIWFLSVRRSRNWLRRVLRSPEQLVPLLLIVPGMLVALAMAVGVLLVPPYDADYELETRARLLEHIDMVRAMATALLVVSALSLIHRASEEDILTFRQADVDFLFGTPVSRRGLLAARLLSDYAMCGLTTFVIVLYVVAPMRLLAPSVAGPGWALEAWLGTLLFYITLMNVGRLAQAWLVTRQGGGLRLAFVVRVGALLAALAWLGSLIAANYAGIAPTTGLVAILSSRVLYWLMLPCGVTADIFVAPITPDVETWPRLAGLIAAAVLSAVPLLLWSRPACESALGATLRRHAVWQAFRKADASSIRAAQLTGRRVRGRSFGILGLGTGAWALVGKTLLYGLRNSPWGLAIVAIIAFAPLGTASRLEGTHFEGLLTWSPVIMLGLLFAWSQRVRLNVREEFSHAATLKALPLSPYATVCSLVVVPAVGFNLFLITAGVCLAAASSMVPRALVYVVLGIAPATYVALAMVHVCSGLLYPAYDPGIGRGFLADLAFMPVAALVCGAIVASAAGALALGWGPVAAAVLGNVTALGAFACALGAAGFLYDRFEAG